MTYDELYLAAITGLAGSGSTADTIASMANAIATAGLNYNSTGTSALVATSNIKPTTVKSPAGVSIIKTQNT